MKRPYRIRNWSEYNATLEQRGSLTFWISDHVLAQWEVSAKSGQRGASQTYIDLAIATFVTIKRLFGLAGRQTEGFIKSIFQQMGVPLSVPDHTTVSRRIGRVNVALPVAPATKKRHVVVDGTGIKV